MEGVTKDHVAGSMHAWMHSVHAANRVGEGGHKNHLPGIAIAICMVAATTSLKMNQLGRQPPQK